jgi:hypothetical protein
MILGKINISGFLEKTSGRVVGKQLSDGKERYYEATYSWVPSEEPGWLLVNRVGQQQFTKIVSTIDLDESLVAFFGLYSGDGAKGSEAANTQHIGLIRPGVSFSQREPNLIKFAVNQFRKIFPEARFDFSLGEDSAYFFAGEGLQDLIAFYEGKLPPPLPIETVRPKLNEADIRYLKEARGYQTDVLADLAFYYQHKAAMAKILQKKKESYLIHSGVVISPSDKVVASLRRPYKKGARNPGGSSRSDETHVGNVSGMGELFLKIMHEIEESILEDKQESSQGLIRWNGVPSEIGQAVDIKQFFATNAYGQLKESRPAVQEVAGHLIGKWRLSKPVRVKKHIRLDPNWCYTSGLYLAEGTTPKNKMFAMYTGSINSSGAALGFTSSENTSLELMLRALRQLFFDEDCVDRWKVKVGSQYFPELVVIGLKHGVPMLRGGNSGDGKLRSMEISIDIKEWGLSLVPALLPYADRYSHVEPTGAGVPRVDFWASSALCRWYFPLLMYATFGSIFPDPVKGFS